MTYTGYHRHATGATLYVKPLPLVDGVSPNDWGSDVIAGSENGALGSYSFAGLDGSLPYEVFIQAGGSPASTDKATASLDVTDTPLTGPNTVNFKCVDDDDSALLEGVRVKVTHSVHGAETKSTDVNGVTENFGLESATWEILARASNYASHSESLAVSGDLSDYELRLTPSAFVPSADPDLCNVAVDVSDQVGVDYESATVTARTKENPTFEDSRLIAYRSADATTDSDGRALMTLIRDVTYTIIVTAGGTRYEFTYTVPNAASDIAIPD